MKSTCPCCNYTNELPDNTNVIDTVCEGCGEEYQHAEFNEEGE